MAKQPYSSGDLPLFFYPVQLDSAKPLRQLPLMYYRPKPTEKEGIPYAASVKDIRRALRQFRSENPSRRDGAAKTLCNHLQEMKNAFSLCAYYQRFEGYRENPRDVEQIKKIYEHIETVLLDAHIDLWTGKQMNGPTRSPLAPAHLLDSLQS